MRQRYSIVELKPCLSAHCDRRIVPAAVTCCSGCFQTQLHSTLCDERHKARGPVEAWERMS